jgi:DNA-binding transcriptional regulator YiaG
MQIWTPEEIKSFRLSLKLSQTELAKRLGVTQNYIHMLEKGIKTPSDTLCLLLNCVKKENTTKERR